MPSILGLHPLPEALSPGRPSALRALSPPPRPLQQLPLNSQVLRSYSGTQAKGDTVYVTQSSCRNPNLQAFGASQDIGWR
mmetsp:Transcript_48618/g.109187  ORF Transcript_48618/g.109187 Transcript_48618/m.109187 type:complete len:80 (+) Transcript_48618:2-241(+)